MRIAFQEGMRGADLFIVNGYPVSGGTILNYGDIYCLIMRGESPAAADGGLGSVGVSDMAGYGDNNSIATREVFHQILMAGDGASEAEEGQGLIATRVGE